MSVEAMPQWFVDQQRTSISKQLDDDARQLVALVEWVASIQNRKVDLERQLSRLDTVPVLPAPETP